jgi:hypothetical protein
MPTIDRERRGRIDLRRPLNPSHPLNAGRVAFWKVLSGRYGGQFWFDLVSGQSGALTSMSGAAAATNGFRPNAPPGGWGSVRFDGSSGFVSLGSLPALNLPGPMTILASINPAVVTVGTRDIVADCNAGGSLQQWSLEINRTAAKITATWGNNIIGTGATALAANTWADVGWSRSGTTGAWNWTIYVNGKPDASGATAVNSNPQQGAAIGRLGLDTIFFFPGSISSVSFWNRGLSAAEVFAERAASQQGYPGVLNRVSPAASFGPIAGGTAPIGRIQQVNQSVAAGVYY